MFNSKIFGSKELFKGSIDDRLYISPDGTVNIMKITVITRKKNIHNNNVWFIDTIPE